MSLMTNRGWFRSYALLSLLLIAGFALFPIINRTLRATDNVATGDNSPASEVGWWMEVISRPEVDPDTGLHSIIVKNPFNGEDEVAYYAGMPLANRHPWLVDGHAFVVPRQGIGGDGVYFLKVSKEKPPERLPTTSNEKCPDCVPALYHWSKGEVKHTGPPQDL